jgi:protein-S-isoprenylcysteine O-methyltransferase Ste14
MNYLVLAGLWVLWCALHSAMSSLTVTGYIKKKYIGFYAYYRMFFNGVSLVTFLFLVQWGRQTKGALLLEWGGYWALLRWILLLVATALFIAGAQKYDLLQFVGMRQIKTGATHAALSQSGHLDFTGIHTITRHPWYLGGIIILWAYDSRLYLGSLIVNAILTIYLFIGTLLEEKKLIAEFGDSYRRYQKQVSMLWPHKWLKAKMLQQLEK